MSNGDSASTLFLICRSASQLCAVPLASVAETMRPLPILAFPALPSYLLGVSIIRGLSMPVVNLAMLIDSNSTESIDDACRFVTLKVAHRQVCIAVKEVIGITELPTTAVQNIPPLLAKSDADITSSIRALDEELLLVLNTAHILEKSEWQELAHESEQV